MYTFNRQFIKSNLYIDQKMQRNLVDNRHLSIRAVVSSAHFRIFSAQNFNKLLAYEKKCFNLGAQFLMKEQIERRVNWPCCLQAQLFWPNYEARKKLLEKFWIIKKKHENLKAPFNNFNIKCCWKASMGVIDL